MKAVENRNHEILGMWKSGLSLPKIAHTFDISRDRVRQILNELEPKEKRKQHAEKILQDIKRFDSIEKNWSRDIIIEGLQLPDTVTWRLMRYLKEENIAELSLKQFMDLIFINDGRIPRHPGAAFPICQGNQIGFKTHSYIIKHLCKQDLGAAFNLEWAKRFKNLKMYLNRVREFAPQFLRRYSYPPHS